MRRDAIEREVDDVDRLTGGSRLHDENAVRASIQELVQVASDDGVDFLGEPAGVFEDLTMTDSVGGLLTSPAGMRQQDDDVRAARAQSSRKAVDERYRVDEFESGETLCGDRGIGADRHDADDSDQKWPALDDRVWTHRRRREGSSSTRVGCIRLVHA